LKQSTHKLNRGEVRTRFMSSNTGRKTAPNSPTPNEYYANGTDLHSLTCRTELLNWCLCFWLSL